MLVIKGVIGCKMHFYKHLKLKCVLAVCVHNHLIMIKIFLISLNNFPSQMPVCVMSHWQAPPTIVDWH